MAKRGRESDPSDRRRDRKTPRKTKAKPLARRRERLRDGLELTRVTESFLHKFNSDPKFRSLLVDRPVQALRELFPEELSRVTDKQIKEAINRENSAIAYKYNISPATIGDAAFPISLVTKLAQTKAVRVAAVWLVTEVLGEAISKVVDYFTSDKQAQQQDQQQQDQQQQDQQQQDQQQQDQQEQDQQQQDQQEQDQQQQDQQEQDTTQQDDAQTTESLDSSDEDVDWPQGQLALVQGPVRTLRQMGGGRVRPLDPGRARGGPAPFVE